MENWKSKIAVVTGASAGIGAAITKALAANDIYVVGLDFKVEGIERISKSFEGRVFPLYCDVRELESIKKAFKWIEEKFGVVHILVNNAGIAFINLLIDDSDEATTKINDTISTNLTGSVHCAREAIKLMKKSNDSGMIINMSSISDFTLPFSIPGKNIYPSTKHAVRALSETLRQELIKTGHERIRVTNMSPGWVRTEIAQTALGTTELPPEFEALPFMLPEDIAEMVIYLLTTPKHVNVTQITVKPVGESF